MSKRAEFHSLSSGWCIYGQQIEALVSEIISNGGKVISIVPITYNGYGQLKELMIFSEVESE